MSTSKNYKLITDVDYSQQNSQPALLLYCNIMHKTVNL